MGTIHRRESVRGRRDGKESQNDIKKLRRENEQLRREIWSLRDEYDKLEEILKRQKNRGESEEYEDRSEEDEGGLRSDYSSEEEIDDEEIKEKSEHEDEDEDDEEEDCDTKEQLENAENHKISSEKMSSGNGTHRLHVDFDDLSVVAEEEEPRRERKDAHPRARQLHENIPFYPGTYEPSSKTFGSSSYYAECPFEFPSTRDLMLPTDASSTSSLASPCSRLPVDPVIPLATLDEQLPRDSILSGIHVPPLSWGNLVLPMLATPESRLPQEQRFHEGTSSEEKPEKPKHFFSPLPSKLKKPEDEVSPATSSSQFGTGTSSSSGRTGSTVISKGQFPNLKGSADICVNGAIPYVGGILRDEQRPFLSSDNLLTREDKQSATSQLIKSVSCQDLTDSQSIGSSGQSRNIEVKSQMFTQSDNTLDNISETPKPFKTHLNVTLKIPRVHQVADVPEIPKLPSVDYRIFSNPFLKTFDPTRQYPPPQEARVTSPLSVQVSEDNPYVRYNVPTMSILGQDGNATTRSQGDPQRLLIPSDQLINGHATSPSSKHQVQITSFERPSPHTLVSPTRTFDWNTLRKINTNPYLQNHNLYQNVPFVPGGVIPHFYQQRPPMRIYYEDPRTRKVSAQTQTSIDGDAHQDDERPAQKEDNVVSAPNSPGDQSHKRTLKKTTSKESKPSSPSTQRRLRKQSSVTSSETVDSGKLARKKTRGTASCDVQEDKNESRSSSSGQDSPRKEQTRRVSLYFNTKKRPSLASVKTTRSCSLDVSKDKYMDRSVNSERERTNSISSRETAGAKPRKSSTSSGNVPWCACWGNGCI